MWRYKGQHVRKYGIEKFVASLLKMQKEMGKHSRHLESLVQMQQHIGKHSIKLKMRQCVERLYMCINGIVYPCNTKNFVNIHLNHLRFSAPVSRLVQALPGYSWIDYGV